jgi:hypothetical protein
MLFSRLRGQQDKRHFKWHFVRKSSPLRLGFPVDAVERWLPSLYPTAPV